ncbi:hypothetical protein DWX95_03610 [Butyricicoccus sp. AF22-28AC]|nr:hypothetical protein DWX95_03610 [Butyricicoccus sp. AF22-28AC]
MTRASLVFVKVQHSVFEGALAEKNQSSFSLKLYHYRIYFASLISTVFQFYVFIVFSSCRFKKPKPPQNLERLRDGFGSARLHSRKGVASSELVWRKVKKPFFAALSEIYKS